MVLIKRGQSPAIADLFTFQGCPIENINKLTDISD